MNSSTLRRLAADHASLHTTELPPHYLFLPTASSTIPDDLTQLTILLTGPQGTPYSQGLWKLHLKIPDDYPKSPPKALFRTRIWHPNVEEKSGSVCVDTLKKDWQPKLTLRDVLITISCLLIQPNPDSALNATAGQLLQDDYESFARQAILMTSIHASIPSNLKEAASAAKRRGEEPGSHVPENTNQRPNLKAKTSSSSSVVMKKLPQRLTSAQSAPVPRRLPQDDESSASELEDENSASKENDPTLSPLPVTAQTPRGPTLVKRPLSDLPTPIEPACETTEAFCLSPSDQNILNYTFSMTNDTASDVLCKGLQLAERSQAVSFTGRGLQDTAADELAAVPVQNKGGDDSARPTKRVCSDEAKENVAQKRQIEKVPERPASVVNKTGKTDVAAPRKASAPGSLGGQNPKRKARIGLRRL